VGELRKSFAMSEQRACRAIGISRSTLRYETQREDPAELRQRLHRWLLREGRRLNHKRVYRLYRQEGLSVRRRKRKRVARGRGPILLPPTRINQRWSMDFMGDTLATVRSLRAERSTHGPTTAACVFLHHAGASDRERLHR
jgi:putative transposase